MMKTALVGILLPDGWGWLSPDPSLVRGTLDALLPADIPADVHEQIILRSLDELLALRAGLAPWELMALAAWTQPAIIGGHDQILAASLVIAVQYTARTVTVEEIAEGMATSTLRGHVTERRAVDLTCGPALRVEALWAGHDEGPAVRAWLYTVPIAELEGYAVLMFSTPDEPDWESFGQLFDAMADTFVVAPVDDESALHASGT